MNVGRRIQMPVAVDPATGQTLPVQSGAPPVPSPPMFDGSKFGGNPVGYGLDTLGDAIGMSPEQRAKWLKYAAPQPAEPKVGVPTLARPELVPPDQQEGLPAQQPARALTPGLPARLAAPGGPRGLTKDVETETRVRGNPVSDEVRAGVDEAHIERRLANQQQADANVSMGEKMGRFAAEQAEAERTFQAYDGESRAREERKVGQLRQQLEGDIQATREGQIDPDRRWNSMSTPSKIMGIIGISLGGYVAGRTGGANQVADRIMHAIDEDNRAQETNLAQRGRAAGMTTQLLGMYREQYKDDSLARAAKRASDIQVARQDLAATLTPDLSAQQRAQAQAIDASLEEKYNETLKAFDDQGRDKVTLQSQSTLATGGKYGGAAGTGTGGLNPKEETDANDLSKELVKSGMPEARTALDRLLKVIPQTGDIPGIGGIHAAASMIGGKAEHLDDLAYNVLGSKQGQEVRQAAAVLFNKQLKDESGAAVSDQELERHKAAFYGARDSDSARRALEAYGERLNSIESTVRSGHSPRVNAVQQERRAQYQGTAPTVTPVNPIGGRR